MEALAIAEGLGEEMREWADNMPESKQGSSKYDDVDACATLLEEQSQSDPIDHDTMSFLNDRKIMIQDPTPTKAARSRARQLDDGLEILRTVIDKLDDITDGNQGLTLAQRDIARELRDALDNIETELQGADFPGMYG